MKSNRKKIITKNNIIKRDDITEFLRSLGDPLREKAFDNGLACLVIGLFSIYILYSAYKIGCTYERLYQNNMIVNTTKSLIDAALGENAGISRVPVETLENLFRENRIEISEQIKILELIERNIKAYVETHALNTNEGPKFEQIIRELKNIQELKRNLEKGNE